MTSRNTPRSRWIRSEKEEERQEDAYGVRKASHRWNKEILHDKIRKDEIED